MHATGKGTSVVLTSLNVCPPHLGAEVWYPDLTNVTVVANVALQQPPVQIQRSSV